MFIDKEDVTAAPGETVNVHCAANGAPRAQITWYKEGSKVIPNRRVALSSQGHLVISAVETSDQGFYTCLANNIAGQDSRNMTIKVQGRFSTIQCVCFIYGLLKVLLRIIAFFSIFLEIFPLFFISVFFVTLFLVSKK